MMEYLPAGIALIKLLLILSATGAAIVLIIGLFHPLTFRVRLRASQLGQRAEIWASYLFGMLKIGVIATPNTQDITLKILFWKKLLQRNQRPRPPRPPKPASQTDGTASPVEPAPSVPPTAEKSATSESPGPVPLEPDQPTETVPEAKISEQVVSSQTEPPANSQSTPAEKPQEMPTQPTSAQSADKATTARIDNSPPEKTTSAAKAEFSAPSQGSTEPELISSTQEPEDVTPIKVSPPPTPADIDTTPLKPISEVAAEQTRQDSETTSRTGSTSEEQSKPTGENWRAKARRFRRDLGNRYRQLKNYIKLFMRKWQIISPIFWRFWGRGKRGLSLSEPWLMVRYALNEPYITGMFHATMAMVAGVVGQFGINFFPVPVFSEPCIYARGGVTAIIRPWRFAAAMLGLLFERDLYRELWSAFKWYRASRQQQ